MTKDEALKLALEVLERCDDGERSTFKAITQIREALAQPAQEPDDFKILSDLLRQEVDRLIAAQRPWVEPTVGEWWDWWRVSPAADETEAEINFADFLNIAQAVVAKFKEKNT